MPLWFWLTFIITFSIAINEILTRLASVKLDVWVNNFWVGCSTVFWCTTLLLGLALFGGGIVLNLSTLFVWGTVVVAFIVVAMISFKLLSFVGHGATVAVKKLIMQGSYLITATIAGWTIYQEPMTWGKISGILLFFVAFFMTDREAFKVFLPKKAIVV